MESDPPFPSLALLPTLFLSLASLCYRGGEGGCQALGSEANGLGSSLSTQRVILSPTGSLIYSRRNCNIWREQDWMTERWGGSMGCGPSPAIVLECLAVATKTRTHLPSHCWFNGLRVMDRHLHILCIKFLIFPQRISFGRAGSPASTRVKIGRHCCRRHHRAIGKDLRRWRKEGGSGEEAQPG